MQPLHKLQGKEWRPTLEPIQEEDEMPAIINKPIEKIKQEEKVIDTLVQEARRRSKSI